MTNKKKVDIISKLEFINIVLLSKRTSVKEKTDGAKPLTFKTRTPNFFFDLKPLSFASLISTRTSQANQ